MENFDTDYLLFERAAALEKAGLAATVLVPTEASRHDPEAANTISRGIVELMARVARVQNLKIIPTRYSEPISLNVAYQIRDSLIKEHLRSVILVTPALRSRRSSLVYRAVLRPAGIQVYCVPVLDDYTPETWTATLHGIEQVTQQFIKLQFYRFYVLPLSRGQSSRADPDYRSRSPSATGQLGRLESHHARLQLVSKPIDNMLIVALQRHALARGLIAFILSSGPADRLSRTALGCNARGQWIKSA